MIFGKLIKMKVVVNWWKILPEKKTHLQTKMECSDLMKMFAEKKEHIPQAAMNPTAKRSGKCRMGVKERWVLPQVFSWESKGAPPMPRFPQEIAGPNKALLRETNGFS